jgi:hypothetical protein
MFYKFYNELVSLRIGVCVCVCVCVSVVKRRPCRLRGVSDLPTYLCSIHGSRGSISYNKCTVVAMPHPQ